MRSLVLFSSLLVSLVLFCSLSGSNAQCDLTEYTNFPGPSCPYAAYSNGGCPCTVTPGTTLGLAPNGHSWQSYYSYLIKLIGVDGVSAQAAWVDPQTTDPNIYLTAPYEAMCNITITWVASVASFRNRIGYFLFDRNTGKIDLNSFQLVFLEGSIGCVAKSNLLAAPNKTFDASSAYQSCLPQGSTLKLGPFHGNASVGWFLDQNLGCNCSNSAKSPHHREYSIDSYNMYIINNFTQKVYNKYPLVDTGRLMAVFREPLAGRVSLSFEDNPGGTDEDYNDSAFGVQVDCPFNLTKIPCNTQATCPYNQTINQETCTCGCANSCWGNYVVNETTCGCYCPLTSCAPPYLFNASSCACYCLPDSCPHGGGLTQGQTAGIATGAVVGGVLAALAAVAAVAALAAAVIFFKFFKKGEVAPTLDAAITDTSDADAANSSPLFDNPVQEFSNPLGGGKGN